MLLVDFETRSRADLKAVGGRNYAEHPSTIAVCACLSLWENEEGTEQPWLRFDWVQGQACPIKAPPEIVAAHNAVGFDRHIWARLGWPEPGEWLDTRELAARAGLPGKLEALGAMIGVPKDKEGNALTLKLSRVRRGKFAGDWLVPDPVPADVLERVVAYCRRDVDILEALVEDLADDWHFDLPEFERQVHAVDRAMGDRGIALDQTLCRALLRADEAASRAACQATAAALGLDDQDADAVADMVRSPEQLRAMLAELGVDVPNTERKTLERVLADLPGPEVVAVIEARLATASIVAGKVRAALGRVSPDGRIRDMLRYYGAHTGRWSAQGLQPHNLPRGDKFTDSKDPAEIAAAFEAAAEEVIKVFG